MTELDTYTVPIVDNSTDEKNTIDVVVDHPHSVIPTAREAVSEMGESVSIDPARINDYDWYTGAISVEDGEDRAGSGSTRTEPSVTPDPATLLEHSAELYTVKNADYGDAWRMAGETMAMWARELGIDEIPAGDGHTQASQNLFIQRLHKLIRAYNLTFGDGEPNNEPLAESHTDASVYAAIHASHALDREDNDG